MLTYSEYYNLVKQGLNALQEKLDEAKAFTQEQYEKALEREKNAEIKAQSEESSESEVLSDEPSSNEGE